MVTTNKGKTKMVKAKMMKTKTVSPNNGILKLEDRIDRTKSNISPDETNKIPREVWANTAVKTKSLSSKIIPAFKEAFVKMSSESTSHGLPNIFRNDNWFIKIFWVLPLLGGTAAAIYCKCFSFLI